MIHHSRRFMPFLRAGILVAVLLAAACGNDRDTTRRLPARTPVTSECGEEEALLVTGQNHVVGPVNYPDLPPVGGDHDQCWATWGVHAEAVPPERWVHNLEHGGVVFLHNCSDGCASEQAAFDELRDLAGSKPQALMTPYAALPGRFAVVAWGHRLVMDCIDAPAATSFYERHVASAELPEGRIASPPPAGCDGPGGE